MSGSNVATMVVTPSPEQMQQPIPAGGNQTANTGGNSAAGNAPATNNSVSAGNQYSQSLNAGLAQANANPPTAIPNPPAATENLADTAGRRVRLRPKPAAVGQIYGALGGLLTPLVLTKGIVFPYQPTITYSQDVNYTSMEIVHANQDFYSYSKTPAVKLTVEGDFTVQNQTEGLYSLACIHFLRTVSKMYFGQNDPKAGTPPPVLLFDAYGQYMFNALPVIVTQFSVTLPKDVDYVAVPTSVNSSQVISPATFESINNSQLTASFSGDQGGYAWLPALFSISVQLTVQNTPQRLRAFDLQQFRTGALLSQGTWV